ncbi:hypothetical protein BH09ACT9_BH09ACT9_23140 [soil metagenome]
MFAERGDIRMFAELEMRGQAQERNSEQNRSEYLVEQKVLDPPAGQFLVAGNGLFSAGSAWQRCVSLEFATRPIEKQQPGEVGLVIAELGHLPIENPGDRLVRAVENVRHPGIAPAQCHMFGLVDVLPQPGQCFVEYRR